MSRQSDHKWFDAINVVVTIIFFPIKVVLQCASSACKSVSTYHSDYWMTKMYIFGENVSFLGGLDVLKKDSYQPWGDSRTTSSIVNMCEQRTSSVCQWYLWRRWLTFLEWYRFIQPHFLYEHCVLVVICCRIENGVTWRNYWCHRLFDNWSSWDVHIGATFKYNQYDREIKGEIRYSLHDWCQVNIHWEMALLTFTK